MPGWCFACDDDVVDAAFQWWRRSSVAVAYQEPARHGFRLLNGRLQVGYSLCG